MFDLPQRNPLSIARATEIFRRFARAKRAVGRTGGPAILALAVALLCGFATFVIEQLRRQTEYFPVPALTHRQLAGLLVFSVLLNAVASLAARHSGAPWSRRLLAAPWPLLSLLLVFHHSGAKGSADAAALRFADRPARCKPFGIFQFPYFIRRIGRSSAPLVVQLCGQPLLLIFVGAGAAVSGGMVPIFIDFYLRLVGLLASYRAYSLEPRGSVSPLRTWPCWPLALLPWGLGLLGPAAIALRTIPDLRRDSHATKLFFDRGSVPEARWTSGSGLLPRMRRSNLMATGDIAKARSVLRSRWILLLLQTTALGILWPLEIRSGVALVTLNLGATTLLAVGLLFNNLKPAIQSTFPPGRRIVFAWLVIVSSSASLGFLFGSSLGLAAPRDLKAHLAVFCTWGGLFGTGLLFGASRWLPPPSIRDLLWLPALVASVAMSGVAFQAPVIAQAVGEALVAASILAWLADPLVGLFYQNIFLSPFSLGDSWRRDLPPNIRRALLPMASALVLPLGGLANGWLDRNSLYRDRLLRLWWSERRGKAEHRCGKGVQTASEGA